MDRSRVVAEESRQKEWTGESFIRDLFGGRYRLDLIESHSLDPPIRPEAKRFYERLGELLREQVDPDEIDRTGEYPKHVVDALAKLGAFGMKIPAEYGGLGLTHAEYMYAIELVGSYDGNITALLSAHQAIGVPQPIRLFGTEEQKRKWLPRCAKGAISAFALTEPAVGSDPARLETSATPTDDGSAYVLDGEKLWCTNGTLAELIVVMARDPDTRRISAFVVEMDTPGVTVEHRCHFMGLRALANAVIRFDHVRIPRENLIGRPGDGLRIALTTLNPGRLSLPAATSGAAKVCTEIVRKWSSVRVQWGQPIGKHEAVAHLNAGIVASAFAMESLARAVGELAEREDCDIRLEAAAAKEWNTTSGWDLLDDTLQVRGGRGYETAGSLRARGEAAIGVERMLRDSRINRIFEGSNEIMHLFIAREGLDEHLSAAGVLIDPHASMRQRLAALPRIALHYLRWYPMRWLGFGRWPRYSRYGKLARYLRYADRATRRLARSIFHGMLIYRAGLERRQRFLFRAVDVALEIFVLTCSVVRARHLADADASNAASAIQLADLAARRARRRIDTLLREMWRNDDAAAYGVGRSLLDGEHRWLERGVIDLGYDAEALRPPTMAELHEHPHAAE